MSQDTRCDCWLLHQVLHQADEPCWCACHVQYFAFGDADDMPSRDDDIGGSP